MIKKPRLLFPLLLLLLSAVALFAGERPVLQEVVVTREGNGARIEIRADQPLTFTSYPMSGLEKWVIDLPGARAAAVDDQSRKMRTPPLERITVRQKEVNGDLLTRIGLDFSGEVNFSVAVDPLDKRRLVAHMTPLRTAQNKPAAAAVPPSVPPLPPAATVAAPSAAKAAPAPTTSAAASMLPAKTVKMIRITTDAIRIETDGRATPIQSLLNRPGRLVLDFAGVTTAQETVPVPGANRFGIVRCRLGNNAGALRIVFEVNGNTFPDYQLKEVGSGLEITLLPPARRKTPAD